MKKIFLSFFSFFIMISFIWFVIGYSKSGNAIFYKHLDLKATLEPLTDFNFYDNVVDQVGEDMKDFNDLNIPDFLSFLEKPLSVFFKVIAYPLVFIGRLLSYIFNVFTVVIKVIFNPKFIP